MLTDVFQNTLYTTFTMNSQPLRPWRHQKNIRKLTESQCLGSDCEQNCSNRVGVKEPSHHSEHQDPQIEPDRPIPDVEEIVL